MPRLKVKRVIIIEGEHEWVLDTLARSIAGVPGDRHTVPSGSIWCHEVDINGQGALSASDEVRARRRKGKTPHAVTENAYEGPNGG